MKFNFLGYRKFLLTLIIIALDSVFLGLKWIPADIWREVILGAGAFYLGSNAIASFSAARYGDKGEK